MQVGVVDHQPHEVGVFVGQPQEDFLLVALPLAPAIMDIYADGERQPDDGDEVAGCLQPLESAQS
ncbi:MAG: hypothetical protein ACYC02_07355, partial [Thiobacillus sp.]